MSYTSDDFGSSLLDTLDRFYNQFFQTIRKPTRYVSGIILLSTIVLLLYGVAAREFEGVVDFGVAELAAILSIWIIFLELPNISYNNEQIAVNYFYLRFSEQIQYYIDVIHYTIIAIGALILFVSTLLVTSTYLVGETSVIGLPRYVYSIPMIYGFGMLLVIYCYQLLHVVTGRSKDIDQIGGELDD